MHKIIIEFDGDQHRTITVEEFTMPDEREEDDNGDHYRHCEITVVSCEPSNLKTDDFDEDTNEMIPTIDIVEYENLKPGSTAQLVIYDEPNSDGCTTFICMGGISWYNPVTIE